MKQTSPTPFEKHVRADYQNRDSFVGWLMNGHFGSDNVDRYGIRYFRGNACITTCVEKYLGGQRFAVYILVQKDADEAFHALVNVPYLERYYCDEKRICLLEGDVEDAPNIISYTWYEVLQNRMEKLLVEN